MFLGKLYLSGSYEKNDKFLLSESLPAFLKLFSFFFFFFFFEERAEI